MNPVVAIEGAWSKRVATTGLWLYELPSLSFKVDDANAGYHVSSEPVVPLGRRFVESPAVEVVRAGAELRVVADLRALAAAVSRSSLSFSCIRLRNL